VVVIVGALSLLTAAGTAEALPLPSVTTLQPITATTYVTHTVATATGLAHATVGVWTGGLGFEPLGTDTLTLPMVAGTGGVLSFLYSIRSTDSPAFDPANIYLETPGGRVYFAHSAGATTAPIYVVQSLAAWAGQQVTLVVAQTQDAAFDQTQILIDSLTVLPRTRSAPRIQRPADITSPATGPAGAVVTYPTPTARDNVDPVSTVGCMPGSGSTFAPGTTRVTCQATNSAGQQGTTGFDVTVTLTTQGALAALIDKSNQLLGTSIAGRIAAQVLHNADVDFLTGQEILGRRLITAYLQFLSAVQSAGLVTPSDAQTLIAFAHGLGL
jgi:hypothetical protein